MVANTSYPRYPTPPIAPYGVFVPPVTPPDLPDSIELAYGGDTQAVSVASRVTWRRVISGFEVTSVRAAVLTAPTGADLILDIKVNGVSILSTLVTIEAGDTSSIDAATPPVVSFPQLADDDEIAVDITQIGSGTAGAGLRVTLVGKRTPIGNPNTTDFLVLF